MTPYYADAAVTLYLGDCREVLPRLTPADCIVTDPPYGETSLAWDRWPDGWPGLAATVTRSLWCFGSVRMFLAQRDEFAGWNLSQDIVWEKHNGSGFAADRFKRVHELVTHWYRGDWSSVTAATPRDGVRARSRIVRRSAIAPNVHGDISASADVRDGSALLRSVLKVRSMQGKAQHPTEKPLGILDPLIAYACPPGGVVLDPFAGSGSTLVAARDSGRRAVGIEADERYCEVIAKRLDHLSLFGGETA